MSPHLKADLARAGLLEGQGVVPVFINTADAAKLLNISASFLNKARLDGSGPPFTKLGFHVRYNVEKILTWAESRTHRSTSEAA
jgi:hypothetical protein